MVDDAHMWIQCMECGNETSADLDDCSCERCKGFAWSAPYTEDDEPPLGHNQ